MNTKPLRMNVWVVLLMVGALLIGAENIYFSTVIANQRHTIRQYMGLEPGPEATPQPQTAPQATPQPLTPEPQESSAFDRKRQTRLI